jgi:hypothetical protein
VVFGEVFDGFLLVKYRFQHILYGVAKLLHNLNPHKAAGPDNITPRDLKDLSSEVSSILTLIFKATCYNVFHDLPGNTSQGYRTAVYGIKHFSFFKDKTNKL